MSNWTAKKTDKFKPHTWFSNPNLQTILPHLFRKPTIPAFVRERFHLSDGDFVDLDFCCNSNSTVCLILHGLESSSNRGYIAGMANNILSNQMDAVVLNFRGCSDETNLNFKSYNSGYTGDVIEVLHYLKTKYDSINLIGFSLGGNVALKLCGETPEIAKKLIQKTVAISVPCDLQDAAETLQTPKNKIFHDRFLKSLKNKLFIKQPQFPDLLKTQEITEIDSLVAFDDYYTARAFGFKNALDYYQRSSSKQYIKDIDVPTLIITAQDDPFFTTKSQPYYESDQNNSVTLITPKNGGHVGFMTKIKAKTYWHEQLAIEFLEGK